MAEMQTVVCDRCAQPEVRPFEVTDLEVQLWKCASCGEVRAWCPDCNQGWIRHLLIKQGRSHYYVCEECDAAWSERTGIGIAACAVRRPDDVNDWWLDALVVKDEG